MEHDGGVDGLLLVHRQHCMCWMRIERMDANYVVIVPEGLLII